MKIDLGLMILSLGNNINIFNICKDDKNKIEKFLERL